MTPYTKGFVQGARDARSVLRAENRRCRIIVELEMNNDDKVDWLNGYANGIKYVAFPLAVGRKKETE